MQIRVAYVTHQDSFNSYGGAQTQLWSTMSSINELGEDVLVKPFNMWHDRFEEFDIVHLFNPGSFPAEALRVATIAKKRGARVAVSPVSYGSFALAKDELGVVGGLLWRALVGVRGLSSKTQILRIIDPYRFIDPLLSLSDIIMPNSFQELSQLSRTFPRTAKTKFHVVPNGVEHRFKHGDPRQFVEKFEVRDFVLFVGRIDKRKNVLKLVRSFVSSAMPTNLVIVGEVADDRYFGRCQDEANQKVLFLPPLPHDSSILESAYAACKVVAFPSYYETPGLAALEGGLAGANVVITRAGGTTEYFRDHAWYVDPESELSIEKAIVDAFTAPKTEALSNHIATNFTWDAVARRTVEGYRAIWKGGDRHNGYAGPRKPLAQDWSDIRR